MPHVLMKKLLLADYCSASNGENEVLGGSVGLGSGGFDSALPTRGSQLNRDNLPHPIPTSAASYSRNLWSTPVSTHAINLELGRTIAHLSALACGNPGMAASKPGREAWEAYHGTSFGYFDMAPHRAFSFPLSHVEETSRVPPFNLNTKDISRLRKCEAFQIIRALLVDQENHEFCDLHSTDSRKDKEAWLLQRDITYALTLPVLEIYRHAAQLAKALLGNRHIFDLELVFRGEARGTFSWLQCFVMDEEDWCLTRGCPGCVVSHAIQAEPTIRMILVACRLSSSLRHQRNASHLPIFDFWSDVMKKTLDEDPFWGPGLWKNFSARAAELESGIEELVRQCIELAPVAANAAARADHSPPTSPNKHVFGRASQPLLQQPTRWVPSIVSGCWTTLLADATQTRRMEASPDVSPRPALTRWFTG
ncbi:MAG: hypothetical protein Q9219_006847 [cf. Caloplaca sp. 3 TL-2023]